MTATRGRKLPMPTSNGRWRKCSRSPCGSRIGKSLDWFFDGWVNGTVFPRFEIKDAKFSTRTGKPTVSATLQQIDAPDDLVTSVPVYGVVGDSKIYLGRVFAEGQETRITLPVPLGRKAPHSRSISDSTDSSVIQSVSCSSENLPLISWQPLVREVPWRWGHDSCARAALFPAVHTYR